jgi:hypothetical protein
MRDFNVNWQKNSTEIRIQTEKMEDKSTEISSSDVIRPTLKMRRHNINSKYKAEENFKLNGVELFLLQQKCT